MSINNLNLSKILNKENSSNCIYRCSKCLSIPLMKVIYQSGKIYIEYRCENKHYEYEDIKSFYTRNINSKLNKIECCKCKTQDKKDNFYYCNKCVLNYCEKHIKLHQLKNGHKLININKIDGFCLNCQFDKNKVEYFCDKCHMNLCKRCLLENHSNHEHFIIKSQIIKDKQIELLKKNITKSEEYFKQLYLKSEQIINELKNQINKFYKIFQDFKELNDIEFKICKDLIYTYEYLDINYLLNYESIFNINNIIKLKDYNFNIDKNYHILSKFQFIYSIYNNKYNTILDISEKRINFDYEISESDKKFLFNNFPPLNDGYPVEIREEFEPSLEYKYYGEMYYEEKKQYYVYHGRGIKIHKCGNKQIGYWKFGDKDGFGIFYYFKGDCSKGIYKNNEQCGFGKILYNSGDIQYGYYNKDNINGISKYIYQNGDMFIGYKKDYLPDGFGIMYSLNGNYYIGEWKEGNKEGIGYSKILFHTNLEGIWKNDQFQFGSKKIDNREKYYGELKNNLKNGYGININSDNIVDYEGSFKNNLYGGFGINYNSNGKVCSIGFFKENKSEGFGKCYNNGKLYYIGYLKNDKRNGFGIYITNNGDRLIGLWVDDKRNGLGIRKNSDGEIYKGQLINEYFEGFCEMYFNNGDYYIGEISKDKREGYGIYYRAASKKIDEGVYLNSNLIYDINQN